MLYYEQYLLFILVLMLLHILYLFIEYAIFISSTVSKDVFCTQKRLSCFADVFTMTTRKKKTWIQLVKANIVM